MPRADRAWLQWQWMSQYRVWEANREVFLWPENWIDPTLRSDASPFFPDLQQDLSRAISTADVAETALQNYLEKLEQVARLDVCRQFHDLENGQDVLRVLARSQARRPVYYMREWVASSRWTAWQKVDLDIASDHVLPVVWNGRPVHLLGGRQSRPTSQPACPAGATSARRRRDPTYTWRSSSPGASTSRASGRPSRPPPQTLVFGQGWPQGAVIGSAEILEASPRQGGTPPTSRSSPRSTASCSRSTCSSTTSLVQGSAYLNATAAAHARRGVLLGGSGSGVEAFVVQH